MDITYLWIDEKFNFRENTYYFPNIMHNIPIWKLHIQDTHYQLEPKTTFKNPFLINDNAYIVLCDAYKLGINKEILPTNKRYEYYKCIQNEIDFKIIQSYNLSKYNMYDIISKVFTQKCYEIGINVYICPESYTIKSNKNSFDNVWIIRYIIEKILMDYDTDIYYDDLILVDNDNNITNMLETLKV
jgi:hypothetical protein